MDVTRRTEDECFPFVRIVGQEQMKRALLLNIVDPAIGGVLIKGEKGTAKSTTVRSLGAILPEVTSSGCQFNCCTDNPRFMCASCLKKYEEGKLEGGTRRMTVVELPLNATEDRISGSLDVEHILSTGERKFEGGVLARANGNLLYVDEVNLLDDHIVDILLDSAAMGRNYVEREGISFSHPAKFILIGSMNPEEGNLSSVAFRGSSTTGIPPPGWRSSNAGSRSTGTPPHSARSAERTPRPSERGSGTPGRSFPRSSPPTPLFIP